MKKLLAFALLVILTASNQQVKAQASCPTIVNSTFRIITDNSNSCLKSASFDFINNTNGSKRINVTVTVSSVEVINTCVDASGQKGVQRNYTTAQFAACNLSDVLVTVTPYNGSDCSGSGCTPSQFSIAGAPLPVTFASFTATRNHNDVLLKWETVTEHSNSRFIIERNMDGTWQPIGTIVSQAPGGYSSNKLSYQFIDMNTSKGISQYRIKQLDIDGKSRYTDIRAVRGEDQAVETVVYPNPSVDGKINIIFKNAAATRDIAVTDMTGRTVKEWKNYSSNSLQVESLNPGMYTLRSIDRQTGEKSVEKLMVAGR